MNSGLKQNLKFVMNNSRVVKQPTKNVGTSSSELQSTINITTNSKIKEKLITKRIFDNAKLKSNQNVSQNNLHHVPRRDKQDKDKLNIHLKTDKSDRSDNFLNAVHLQRTPLELSRKAFLRENSYSKEIENKENAYVDVVPGYTNGYNSNNSTSSIDNKKCRSKTSHNRHFKHASEVPPSFRNLDNYNSHNSNNSNSNELGIGQIVTHNKNQIINSSKKLEGSGSGSRGHSKNPLNIVKLSIEKGRKFDKENEVKIIKNNPRVIQISDHIKSAAVVEKTCDNCNDVNYHILLNNYKELKRNQDEILITTGILLSYIKSNNTATDKKKMEIELQFSKKLEEMKKLQIENAVIKRQNLELKSSFLKVLQEIKTFDTIQSDRQLDLGKLINELLTENEYLRYMNENVIIPVRNDTGEVNSDKEINCNLSPNICDEQNIFPKQKTFHKRQKTHINVLHHLQSLNSCEDSDTILSNSLLNTESSTASTDTVAHKADVFNDVFDSTIKEMKNNKRKSTVDMNILDETNIQHQHVNNNSNNQINTQKPVYLFYRTPTNKENKNINFFKDDQK